MTDIAAKPAGATARDESWFGHPRGLAYLFFAELWERFSFYGMRALLVFYLLWHFLMDRTDAYAHYAAYSALVYLGPLIGGYLADKYIGFRKAVIFGAILLTCGHFTMALEGDPAKRVLVTDAATYEITRPALYPQADPDGGRRILVEGAAYPVIANELAEDGSATKREISYRAADGETVTLTGRFETQYDPLGYNLLFLALGLIAIGTGFLKANISSIVGRLYEPGDGRRDAGFTLFYLSINIGAATASVVCGWLGFTYGWKYGFGLAGIGMAIGLIVFLVGQRSFEGKAEPPDAELLRRRLLVPGLSREVVVYLVGLAMVGAAWFLLQRPTVVGTILDGTGLIALSVALFAALFRLEAEARDRLLMLLVLIFSSILFWTLFDQGPSSLNVFTADFVDLNIGPFAVPAPTLQFLNPAFIVFLAIPFSILWTRLDRGGLQVSTPVKFAIALIQIGLGFFALNIGIALAGDGMRVAVIWIVLMYLLHTTGELCLSPVGLSAVTKLAPHHMAGFMMGFWFLGTAYAQKLAGWVAQRTVTPEGADAATAIAQYNQVYMELGAASIGLGIVLVLVSPFIKKRMHGIR